MSMIVAFWKLEIGCVPFLTICDDPFSYLFQSLNQWEYRKSTSIRHFEQCNQQLSNLICQNYDGSIKILLDVGNQQHAV